MTFLTAKGMLVSYLALAGVITVVCLFIYGWTEADQWANTWLPALLGPAILVLAYAAAASMGQWRIERQIRMLDG